MKKALFITHIPPFPAIGGDRVRVAQSLRLLTEIYDVDIVYLTHDRDAAPMTDYLPEIRSEKRFYVAKPMRYLRAARTLFNSRTLAENHFFDRRMARYVREHGREYDLIFCATAVSGQYASEMSLQSKVLDMIDSFTLNYDNAAARARGLKKLLLRTDAKRMRRYEAFCREAFPSVAYISPVDRDYTGDCSASLHIVHNAIAPAAASTGAAGNVPELPGKNIVFLGKMDYEPNIIAVTFFARKVMPLLRERYPDIRFTIVGTNPIRKVKALEKIEGVTVTGYVESVAPYLRGANLVVAPMLSGSGVQNKILEAVAMGSPVATTPIGFQGIEMLADVVEVIAPTAEEWVARLPELLESPERLAEMRLRGAGRIAQEFGLPEVRRQFGNFVKAGL